MSKQDPTSAIEQIDKYQKRALDQLEDFWNIRKQNEEFLTDLENKFGSLENPESLDSFYEYAFNCLNNEFITLRASRRERKKSLKARKLVAKHQERKQAEFEKVMARANKALAKKHDRGR